MPYKANFDFTAIIGLHFKAALHCDFAFQSSNKIFYPNCPMILLKNFELTMSIKMSEKVTVSKGC